MDALTTKGFDKNEKEQKESYGLQSTTWEHTTPTNMQGHC